MKTQCNCHVLFCFLSLTLLAAQVSACKQSPSPFHSVASPQFGAQLAIPVLTFRGTPQAALPNTALTPSAPCPHCSGHLRASQPSPERPRGGRLWKSHPPSRQGIARSQLPCGIPLASVPRGKLHTASLSSPGPAVIGKEGGKASRFRSPACAEPPGCNISYLLPQSELQPELGRR